MEVLIKVEQDQSGDHYSLSQISEPFAANANIKGYSVEEVTHKVQKLFPQGTQVNLVRPERQWHLE